MDPLAQLKDIEMPIDPVWWPPAPGWWLLAILCLVCIVYLYRLMQQRMYQQRPFKQARSLLETHRLAFAANDINREDYVEELNQLLKRTTLHAAHRAEAAALSGSAWLSYLDNLSNSKDFSDGSGQALGNMRYQANTHFDVSQLHTLVEQLLRNLEREK